MGDEGIVRPVLFRGEPITLVTIDFLQSICEQRQRVIRSLLLSDLPPWAVPGGSPHILSELGSDL